MEKWELILFKIKIIYCLAGAPAYSGHRCDCWPRHSSYQLQVTCWRLKISNKQTWLLLFFLKNLKGSLLGYFQGWEAAHAPTRWVFGGPAWPNLCCLQHVNTVIVWKRFYVAYDMRTQVVLMLTTCEYIMLNHVNITISKTQRKPLMPVFAHQCSGCKPKLWSAEMWTNPEDTIDCLAVDRKLLFFLMQPKDQLRYQFVYIVHR